MAATDTTLEALNSLLRGELAATETYQQALAKIGEDRGATELQHIHTEHREAANTLRLAVHHHGGHPDQSSGAWGTFAKAVEGVAKLFGNTAALEALELGEKHGLTDYEKALEDQDLPDDCKVLIRDTLVPQTRSHIQILERLEKAR